MAAKDSNYTLVMAFTMKARLLTNFHPLKFPSIWDMTEIGLIVQLYSWAHVHIASSPSTTASFFIAIRIVPKTYIIVDILFLCFFKILLSAKFELKDKCRPWPIQFSLSMHSLSQNLKEKCIWRTKFISNEIRICCTLEGSRIGRGLIATRFFDRRFTRFFSKRPNRHKQN